MSVTEAKQKKVQLLEETRARRAEIEGHLEGLRDQLAKERVAKLAGEGKGSKIPALKKSIAKLEKELADLQVDEVLEKQIQELEGEEHQEAVREAEERRDAAIESLEEAVGVYREARAGFLEAVAQLDQAREAARGAHFHWMGVTGTPWASATIQLYPWDSQQGMRSRSCGASWKRSGARTSSRRSGGEIPSSTAKGNKPRGVWSPPPG